MKPNTNVLPGAFDLIKQSLIFYKKNYKFLMVLGLIPLIVHVLGSILSDALILTSHASIGIVLVLILITIIVSLAGFVLQVLFPISLLTSISEISKGNTSLDLKKVYIKSLELFFPYLWVSILVMATMFVPSLFLFIPALILGLYLSLSVYAFIFDDKRGLSALTTSLYYVRGSWWAVFWRSLVIALLSFVVILLVCGFLFAITYNPFVLGGSGVKTLASCIFIFVIYSVLYPLIVTNSFLIYKNLKLLKPEPDEERDLKVSRVWFKVLSILSAILIPLIIIIGLIVGIMGIIYGAQHHTSHYQYSIERY